MRREKVEVGVENEKVTGYINCYSNKFDGNYTLCSEMNVGGSIHCFTDGETSELRYPWNAKITWETKIAKAKIMVLIFHNYELGVDEDDCIFERPLKLEEDIQQSGIDFFTTHKKLKKSDKKKIKSLLKNEGVRIKFL